MELLWQRKYLWGTKVTHCLLLDGNAGGSGEGGFSDRSPGANLEAVRWHSPLYCTGSKAAPRCAAGTEFRRKKTASGGLTSPSNKNQPASYQVGPAGRKSGGKGAGFLQAAEDGAHRGAQLRSLSPTLPSGWKSKGKIHLETGKEAGETETILRRSLLFSF